LAIDKRAYWVWLQHALGAGSSKQNRILTNYGDLEDFYAAGIENWLLEGYFTQNELGKLNSYSVSDASALIEYSEKIGQKVLTPDCEDYPEPLRQIHNPPCALYVKGTLPDFSANPAIAVVGTRKATATGVATARSFAYELAKRGAVVVSGGALGIDTAAHKGALQAGGKTVCVLGCGIDYNYLMSNASLRESIALSGAVLSEYPPNTQAINSNFPIRNRIISGLTLGTLVIEAAGKSGSLITAQCALEQGRDVFAVPAGIYSPVSQGVNSLIKAGAKPVSNAGEILEEYLYRFSDKIDLNDNESNVILPDQPKPEPKAAKMPENCSADAASLYAALTKEPCHISELERKTGIPTPRLLTAVTELELSGCIRSYSGRRYRLPD
jgi:DNA processing protein